MVREASHMEVGVRSLDGISMLPEGLGKGRFLKEETMLRADWRQISAEKAGWKGSFASVGFGDAEMLRLLREVQHAGALP